MTVRLLMRGSDGTGGEFTVEADYTPDLTADPAGHAIDYYNGFWITNTTARDGAVQVVRRDTEQIMYTQPIPAGYARQFTDVSALGTPAQRRRFDVRPQWPA